MILGVLAKRHLLAAAACRLRLEALTAKQLQECLNHLLKGAGNPKLLTASLIATLCEHAAGNLRLVINMANGLLAAASCFSRLSPKRDIEFKLPAPMNTIVESV
jgi:hypothetical protein